MRIKKLSVILVLFLLALIITSLWLNYKHNTLADGNIKTEIWAHRGEHSHLPENSKAAVDMAYLNGFTGVEIDVFYDETLGLVVSHDQPYIPVDGKILTLDKVITGYGNSFKFWIDLKNLNSKNLKKIRRALNMVFESEDGLKERSFIESGNGRALRRMNPDFNCIYWVQYNRGVLRGFVKLYSIKFLMSVTDFSGITTDHRYIDDDFRRQFKGKTWMVFTVNEVERIELLKEIPEVKVLLTDLPFLDIKAIDNGSK